MFSTQQQSWLISAYTAAVKAGHIWPAMAACEASLESSWGASKLCVQARNLFGAKQHQHPIFGTLNLPTREFLHHAWTVVDAAWVEYPSLADCFIDRMSTLKALAPHYPHYSAALSATTPEAYIAQVSQSWSTDPQRGAKVLSIYRTHSGMLMPQAA